MQTIDLAALFFLALTLGALALGRRVFVPALLAFALSAGAVSMNHWQAVPMAAFALGTLLLVVILARRRPREPKPAAVWRRLLVWTSVAAMIAAAVAPYYFFPLFSLPAPSGQYAIGTIRIEWVDTARLGLLEDAANEPRRVTVQLWYPAEADDRKPYARYLPAEHIRTEGASIAANAGYKPFELLHLSAIPTHARVDAEPRRDGAFPLVLFNHGYHMYPAQNTPLFEELASHGYVVASIGHPYDSSRIDFADGSHKPTTPFKVTPALVEALDKLVARPDLENWKAAFPAYAEAVVKDRLTNSEAAWQGDTAFVLAALQAGKGSPLLARLAERIDFSHLAYGGMSFGGGIAVKSCDAEPRCRAAFSLDGVVYDPAMFDHTVRAPLLVLHTDWLEYPLYRGQLRDAAVHPMDFAFRRWQAEGEARDDYRLRVRNSAHMAMTDLVRLTRWPGRDKAYGTIAPGDMDGILTGFTLAFLDRFVRGMPSGFPEKQLAQWPLVAPHDSRRLPEHPPQSQ
ncbi:MAG: hypothetical protein J0I77_04470 [Rudaea sp.]|nr:MULTISPECIES: hypothetical protein [unclassified Rudaea]MBN8884948.1 hypothetical protein [Rudaea sp.]MBR0344475.1 hypothetical protein [Rudaea sp.]